MSRLSDEAKFRIKQFLGDCLFHVQRISKKPVGSDYLVKRYGGFMRMDEWPDVASTSYKWEFVGSAFPHSVGASHLIEAISNLETM